MNATIDPKLFRHVMGHFATGVTVLTYRGERKPAGMTANAFMSVSMEPPLVLVSVRQESRFAASVNISGRYGVNFLLERQQDLSSHFGGRPIADLPSPFVEDADVPLLRDCMAQVVARVVDVYPAGDHLLYIGQIESLSLGEERKPLIFYSGKYERVDTTVPEPTRRCADARAGV